MAYRYSRSVTAIASGGLLLLTGACFTACSTADLITQHPSLLVGKVLPLAELTTTQLQADERRTDHTLVIFLLECADCSALGAFPFTKSDRRLPKPVFVLHKSETTIGNAISAKGVWADLAYLDKQPSIVAGLSSFAALIKGDGTIRKAEDLTNFRNMAEAQKWASVN